MNVMKNIIMNIHKIESVNIIIFILINMKIVSVNISKETDELVIEFHQTNIAILNALRRIILAEIPAIAIEDVVFHENSGVMENEIVAHRLGLLPLKWSSLDTDGCVSFDYTAKEKTTIYAKDLVCQGCEMLYPDIVLTKLGKDQSLKFTAYTEKGTGQDHSKWRVVSNCYFKQLSEDKFHFFIEPIGNISHHDIFRQSLEILTSKINNCKNILLDACKSNDEYA